MAAAKPIGIVGLGLMGAALAERLTGAGHAVLGFDIDPGRGAAFGTSGGTVAASLPDLVQRSDLIFVAVFDTDQVETQSTLLPELSPAADRIVFSVTSST